MLPGCAAPLPAFREGAVVAVFVAGNPAAVAVGEAVMDSEQAAARLGGKGRLLAAVNYYGDCLWQLGRPQPQDPNAGFSVRPSI